MDIRRKILNLSLFIIEFYVSIARAIDELGLNNNFLHINDVNVTCFNESNDAYPYKEALLKCYNDRECSYVRVIEYDVYKEEYGKSKLCNSINLNNVHSINNGRISIKRQRLFDELTNENFNVTLNRRGTCEGHQLLGETKSVLSVVDAAKECERLNCDYFTMSFLVRFANTIKLLLKCPSAENTAWFCTGKPSSVYQNGFITLEKRYQVNEEL